MLPRKKKVLFFSIPSCLLCLCTLIYFLVMKRVITLVTKRPTMSQLIPFVTPTSRIVATLDCFFGRRVHLTTLNEQNKQIIMPEPIEEFRHSFFLISHYCRPAFASYINSRFSKLLDSILDCTVSVVDSAFFHH